VVLTTAGTIALVGLGEEATVITLAGAVECSLNAPPVNVQDAALVFCGHHIRRKQRQLKAQRGHKLKLLIVINSAL
jgi:hypothetical protein